MIEQGRPNTLAQGHEPLETNVRAVYITAAVLTAVVIVSFLLMLGLLELFAESTGVVPASQFATPDRGALRAQQLQSLRAREAELLREYEWVDRAAGIARIPIERAIQIVANEGLTGAGENPTGPALAPSTPQPATSANGDEPPRLDNDQP